MEKQRFARHGLVRVAAVAAFAALVAACDVAPPTAAPVLLRGDVPGIGREAAVSPMPLAAPRYAPARRSWATSQPPPASAVAPAIGPGREARHIVVRPGQSVGGLARDYHVSAHAIVAANHLTPPYKIEIGQRLVIPGAGESGMAMEAGQRVPEHAGHAQPEIIPLDGPAPARVSERSPGAASLTPPDAAAGRPHQEPSAAAEARADAAQEAREEAQPRAPAPHGGRFPWPVRGRVLAGYGVGAGGRHNDGINIAAPRGAPVKAVDAGIVAYAGNQLRGYGNLILVKHADGWISAYAHCEDLLVKRGEKVRRGQVIAKVGETGGVKEPQLHFELRRGKRAVDPREFLAPAPTAAGPVAVRPG